MTLCLLASALVSSLIVVRRLIQSFIACRSVAAVVCRLLRELSSIGIRCGHLLLRRMQSEENKSYYTISKSRMTSPVGNSTHRIDLRKLLEPAWHHICSIEVRVGRKVHQLLLLTRSGLLRLHRTGVVVGARESPIGSHCWISNRSKIRGGCAVATHAST